MNQFNEYIGLIVYYDSRKEVYKSVLKRCKNKESHPLVLLALFSIHRLEQTFSLDTIKNELYRDIYYKLTQNNQKEFNLDYDSAYKDIYLSTKLKEDVKSFFNIIANFSPLASLTSDLFNILAT